MVECGITGGFHPEREFQFLCRRQFDLFLIQDITDMLIGPVKPHGGAAACTLRRGGVSGREKPFFSAAQFPAGRFPRRYSILKAAVFNQVLSERTA